MGSAARARAQSPRGWSTGQLFIGRRASRVRATYEGLAAALVHYTQALWRAR